LRYSNSDTRNYCDAVVGKSSCFMWLDRQQRSTQPLRRSGSGSHCGSIGDRDERNFCYAKANKQTSSYGSIGNRDKRNYCYALVGRQRSSCGSIYTRVTWAIGATRKCPDLNAGSFRRSAIKFGQLRLRVWQERGGICDL